MKKYLLMLLTMVFGARIISGKKNTSARRGVLAKHRKVAHKAKTTASATAGKKKVLATTRKKTSTVKRASNIKKEIPDGHKKPTTAGSRIH